MAALPYMPLYVADYMADAAHLTTAGHGAYLLLIMTYWQRGEALPADETKLARIARMTSDEWESVADDLREFFEVDDGRWLHSRIEAELQKVRDKSEAASIAGKRSAVQRAFNGRSTGVEQTFNHTDTDTDTDRKICAPKRIRLDGFDDFWKAKPRRQLESGALTRGSRKKAEAQWVKLNPDDRQAATAGLVGYAKANPDGSKYVQDAERYLRDRRWNDFEAAPVSRETQIRPIPPDDPKAREVFDFALSRWGPEVVASWFSSADGRSLIRMNCTAIVIEPRGKVARERIRNQYFPHIKAKFGEAVRMGEGR